METRAPKSKLPKKHFVPVYVDLWPTDGSDSFATATTRAITSAAETTTTRLLELGKSLFEQLRPNAEIAIVGSFGIVAQWMPQSVMLWCE